VFMFRYALAGSRGRLLHWLTGGLLVATVVCSSVVVAAATKAQIAADTATMGSLERLGADLIILRDPEPHSPTMVGDLPEGTHRMDGSVYSLREMDTETEIGRDFVSIGLPRALCGNFTDAEVRTIETRDGVISVSGALLAAYDSVSERLLKVEVEGAAFNPDRVIIDSATEAELEVVVQSDSEYATLAAEQSAIFDKPEEALNAKEQARLDELSDLLAQRRAEIYHEQRPDVFSEPVVREEQQIEPPEPEVTSDSFIMAGVSLDNPYVHAEDVISGGYFALENGARDVAVVQVDFAASRGLFLGDTIDVPGKTFEIVGIASTPLGSNGPDVFVHRDVLQEHLGAQGQCSVLFVGTESSSSAARIRNDLMTSYVDLRVSDLSEVAEKIPDSVDRNTQILSTYGWLLTLLLGAASILLLGLMGARMVTRRSREVATLRAIGWPVSKVAVLCVTETVVIVALGLVFGVCASALVLGNMPVSGQDPPLAKSASSTAFVVTLAGQDAQEYLAPVTPIQIEGLSLSLVLAACVLALLIAVTASLVATWSLHRLEPVALLRRR